MDEWKRYKDSNPELTTLEEMRFIIPKIKKYVSELHNTLTTLNLETQ